MYDTTDHDVRVDIDEPITAVLLAAAVFCAAVLCVLHTRVLP